MGSRTTMGEENRSAIVTYLLAQNSPQTLKEVTAAVGLDYSTVHRHMDSLMSSGIVEFEALMRPRNGTRMAFKAVDASGMKSVDYTGKLQDTHKLLQTLFMFYATVLPPVTLKHNLSLHMIPGISAAAGIGDIFRVANRDLLPPGFPRVARANIQTAIDQLEKQIIMYKAILNNPALWDKRVLKDDGAFLVKPESIKLVEEFITSLGSEV